MPTGIIRTLAVGAGAGALLLGMAGPALAATSVTTLPANVKIASTDTVAVNVPNAAVCAAGFTDFRAFIPGRQDAVAVSGQACSGTTLVATVTPTASAKKNAVVKFTSMVNGQMVVQTLVVHVDKAKPANPGQGKKP